MRDMEMSWTTVANRTLSLAALAMGAASIFLNGADKSPIYFLLAYVLWRLG